MSPSADTELPITVDRLDAKAVRARIDELVDVLIDSVEGGASIGFHHPLSPRDAAAFWRSMASDIEAQRRHLLVAKDGDRIVAAVMLALPAFENGFNRADVQKLLVLQSHRRRGIARKLMEALETLAKEDGRGLLVLDSSTDTDGTFFYRRHGWRHVGDIPDYASLPDGKLHPTSIFYKQLEGNAP